MTMITKSLVTGTSVTCAGILIWWALRKCRKFMTDPKEDRNSPSNGESVLKPVNEDKIMVAPASKEHVQIEQDFKLGIVSPLQSDIVKNSQAVKINDINPNPPCNSDSKSLFNHTAKVVFKQLGEFPLADVSASVEPLLKSAECTPEQPILIDGVKEELMVPEEQLKEKPVSDIKTEEVSQVFFTITVPSAEKKKNIEVELSSSPVLNFEIPYNLAALVDPIIAPVSTIAVESLLHTEKYVATPQVLNTKQQITNVEPDIEAQKKSNVSEHPSLVNDVTEEPKVPEKQFEEKPVPDIEIGEPSPGYVTVPSPVAANEEIIEVADASCCPVLESEILSNPVIPIDLTVVPLLPIVVEQLPVPEVSVAAQEVSIIKLQNTNVEPDVEEKKKYNSQDVPSLVIGSIEDPMVQEKPLEEKPVSVMEIEEFSLLSVSALSPVAENEEIIDVPEESTSTVLDSEILSHPDIPVDHIVPLPTTVIEPIPVPETSVAVPEVSVAKLQTTDAKADVEEKKKSTSPVLDSQILSNPVMLVDSIALPLPTIVVEPLPVPETSITAPKVSNLDVNKDQSGCLPRASHSGRRHEASRKCLSELNFEALNPLYRIFMESNKVEAICFGGPILRLFEALPAVETLPAPETSVAVPEVSIPTIQNANAERNKQEDMCQIIWQNVFAVPEISLGPPEVSITKLQTTDVEADVEENNKSTSQVLDSEILSNPVMLVNSIAVPLSIIVVKPLPVPETSITAPKVSNLGVKKDSSGYLPRSLHSGRRRDASRKSSSELNLEGWNPLYRIFMNSSTEEAICFGGPILRLFKSFPAVETLPVPDTTVAVQEASIPALQSANAESNKQEDMCQINWQNWFAVPEASVDVPKVSIPTPQRANVEQNKQGDKHQIYRQNCFPFPETSVDSPETSHLANSSKENSCKLILDAWNPLYRTLTEWNTEKAICIGGPLFPFFEDLLAVETSPVPETSVAAPELSNWANGSNKNSSDSKTWDPLYRIFMESRKEAPICFGGPIKRFFKSKSILRRNRR